LWLPRWENAVSIRTSGAVRWLTLAVVVPVIAGILAMHSLSLEDGQSSVVAGTAASSTTVAGSRPPATSTSNVVAATACESLGCGDDQSMSSVECILALMWSLSLIVLLRRSRRQILVTTMRPALPPATHPLDRADQACEPSLLTLSVCRT
jgi:Family of unknown function (DUF6153)